MKLYSIIGEKLGHSMSPFTHNHILNALGIQSNYAIVEIKRENLPKSIDAFKTLGYSGVNVTIPYKEMIMPYLDEISSEAQAIGAVNTIKFQEGKACGYNTDYFGFASMLERFEVDIENKSVVIFGAGGAAKALIAYFNDAKAKSILVVSKTNETMEKLKSQFPYIHIQNIAEFKNEKYDIAVNATPVGMYPNVDASIVGEDFIKNYSVCVDIVYNPMKTKFLQYAEANGIKAVDGLYMLIDQAIKAQEIFQNQTIDKQIGCEIYDLLKEQL